MLGRTLFCRVNPSLRGSGVNPANSFLIRIFCFITVRKAGARRGRRQQGTRALRLRLPNLRGLSIGGWGLQGTYMHMYIIRIRISINLPICLSIHLYINKYNIYSALRLRLPDLR